ncbi:FAD-dependent thymidylate synthase, partial [Acinetobacter indicus]|uniref:FAD-dependent thymidylate synthase n=1 Tax=Acinetobacter indicus TaxID=756892 RepID=UPI0011774731
MRFDPLNDGISSVELLNRMGDDLMVVNAARVSMAKESHWVLTDDGELRLSERDQSLIRYLARHKHWTPFSHPQVQLRIKMPIFVARQWFKHTVGFTRNEVSRRYVDDTPE